MKSRPGEAVMGIMMGRGINEKRRLCSRGGGRVNQVSLSGPRDWGER